MGWFERLNPLILRNLPPTILHRVHAGAVRRTLSTPHRSSNSSTPRALEISGERRSTRPQRAPSVSFCFDPGSSILCTLKRHVHSACSAQVLIDGEDLRSPGFGHCASRILALPTSEEAPQPAHPRPGVYQCGAVTDPFRNLNVLPLVWEYKGSYIGHPATWCFLHAHLAAAQ